MTTYRAVARSKSIQMRTRAPLSCGVEIGRRSDEDVSHALESSCASYYQLTDVNELDNCEDERITRAFANRNVGSRSVAF